MRNDEEHIETADSDFGNRLIEALTEALAVARGEKEPAHISRRPTGLTPSPAAIIDLTD